MQFIPVNTNEFQQLFILISFWYAVKLKVVKETFFQDSLIK